MGVQICIRTCSNLNDNENAYVDQIINKLVGQLEEMKKLYDVNETIGTVSYFLGYLISSKCYVRRSNLLIMLVFSIKDVVRVQWICKIIINKLMVRELAFLYSQVVIYLNTLNSLTILTSEVRLIEFFHLLGTTIT